MFSEYDILRTIGKLQDLIAFIGSRKAIRYVSNYRIIGSWMFAAVLSELIAFRGL